MVDTPVACNLDFYLFGILTFAALAAHTYIEMLACRSALILSVHAATVAEDAANQRHGRCRDGDQTTPDGYVESKDLEIACCLGHQKRIIEYIFRPSLFPVTLLND